MNLSLEQQAVVDAILTHKNIVVTASAGSGKTRVLIACYAKMSEAWINPGSVAIVTYTQVAAAELSQRIRDQELPEPGFVGTLHSLMLRLLRSEGWRMGFKGVAVVDERTATNALRESIARVNFRGSLAQAQKIVAAQPQGSKEAMLFNDYHQKLAADGLVTFDGILYWASRILKDNGGVVPFTHLMVDEYQDVSRADHDLYLAMKVSNRFIVGDVRQAIFGFRGGDPTCMEELVKSPEWTAFSLKTNYRSVPEIIIAANSLAPHLPVKEKMEVGNLDLTRSTVDAFDCSNERHQFEAIADFISDFGGTSRAIICRYNWQIQAVAEHLRDHDIPHRVHGAAKKPPQWEAAQALVGFLSNPESEVMAYALASITSETEAKKMRKEASDQCVSLGSLVWAGEIPIISQIGDVLTAFYLDPTTKSAVLSIYEQLSIMDRSWSSLAAAMADPAALMPKITDSTVPLLCTIHASKGREWDSVCLPYWCDELFPGNRKSGEDEEWRLAYVAITRARTNLVICSVAEAPKYPGGASQTMNLSRFIKAIIA